MRTFVTSCLYDVTKVGNFYNGGLWGNLSIFVDFSRNFVSGYIKNVDTHRETFGQIKEEIKMLSPKSLWQTYMKWTVVLDGAHPSPTWNRKIYVSQKLVCSVLYLHVQCSILKQVELYNWHWLTPFWHVLVLDSKNSSERIRLCSCLST